MTEPVETTAKATDPTLPKTGRPSKAELDEREAALEARETSFEARFAAIEAELSTRQSIDEVQPRHDGQELMPERKGMGQAKRLDADKYIERHQDKKLLWINDLNGDVQRWIDAGAEPVPVLTEASKTFEGITDRVESQWVRAVGGDDGMGNHFWVYLLMIDPEVYEEIKIGPERDRQAMIRRAMSIGQNQAAEETEKGFVPYAPNLPSGNRGVEITHETAG